MVGGKHREGWRGLPLARTGGLACIIIMPRLMRLSSLLVYDRLDTDDPR